jgi:hypothetical protein
LEICYDPLNRKLELIPQLQSRTKAFYDEVQPMCMAYLVHLLTHGSILMNGVTGLRLETSLYHVTVVGEPDNKDSWSFTKSWREVIAFHEMLARRIPTRRFWCWDGSNFLSEPQFPAVTATLVECAFTCSFRAYAHEMLEYPEILQFLRPQNMGDLFTATELLDKLLDNFSPFRGMHLRSYFPPTLFQGISAFNIPTAMGRTVHIKFKLHLPYGEGVIMRWVVDWLDDPAEKRKFPYINHIFGLELKTESIDKPDPTSAASRQALERRILRISCYEDDDDDDDDDSYEDDKEIVWNLKFDTVDEATLVFETLQALIQIDKTLRSMAPRKHRLSWTWTSSTVL